MGTTIRTVLITGRTMATPTTAPTMDTAATVTIDIIVTITIITGKVMLTWHSAKSQASWLGAIRASSFLGTNVSQGMQKNKTRALPS